MGIKLVIVDDAPFIREALRAIVRGTEIEFAGEATDGEEALEVVSRLRPDVVLMDIVMPKKNGIEVSRELLEKNPKLKIIACSTEGQEGLLMRALDAGCCNFISKPFTAEGILKVIRSAMDADKSRTKKIER